MLGYPKFSFLFPPEFKSLVQNPSVYRIPPRRLIVKTFARTVVEFLYDLLDLGVANGGEVGILGKVLANQPIHVFVGASLSGGIGMCKVEIGLQGLGNGLVLGKLLAVVAGDRMDKLAQRAEQLQRRLGHGFRLATRNTTYPCQSRLALCQGHQSPAMAF